MTPETWQLLITTVGTCFSAFIAYLTLRQNVRMDSMAEESKAAAVKVEEVKKDLKVSSDANDGKLAALAKVADKTHEVSTNTNSLASDTFGVVDGTLGAQMHISAIALRRLAELPGATDSDKKAAADAETVCIQHDERMQRYREDVEQRNKDIRLDAKAERLDAKEDEHRRQVEKIAVADKRETKD